MYTKVNPYVIVAEDDPDDTLMLKDAFIESGEFIPNFVDNGRALLDTINQLINLNVIPRLVMIDLNMPILDGSTVVQHLKKDKRTCNIPLVILSTSKNNHDILWLQSLGVDDFFSKPSSYTDLIAIVKMIIQKWL